MTNQQKMGGLVLAWLPFAVTGTLIALLVYGVVQYDMRSGANDPQVNIAEDIARDLDSGIRPGVILGRYPQVNIGESLSPFISLYHDDGSTMGSSGLLRGEVVAPPKGVFDNARNGDNRITWQPEKNVRIAIVVRHFGGDTPGFVLAGRSLREVEVREKMLTEAVLLGWAAILVGTFISLYFGIFLRRRFIS